MELPNSRSLILVVKVCFIFLCIKLPSLTTALQEKSDWNQSRIFLGDGKSAQGLHQRDFGSHGDRLWEWSKTAIFGSCVLIVMIGICVYVCYRPDPFESKFERDIFLCYADEDRPLITDKVLPALQRMGLSVFLPHQNFSAGLLVLESIVRAVRTCHWTVVVLTPTLADKSGIILQGTLLAAKKEAENRKKSLLIFLLFDNMKVETICSHCPEMFENLQNSPCIRFSSQSFGLKDIFKFYIHIYLYLYIYKF